MIFLILVIFHTAGNKEKKKKKILVQNLDGLLPTGWARHRAHRRGRWAGRWALQAVGRAGARRSGRVRECAGVSGRARTGAGARTVCMRRQASMRTCGALGARGAGSERQGAAGRGRTRGRARQDARQCAAGARQARGLGGLGAAWACSWARLGVLVHLTQFLARFDSVVS